MKTPSKKPSFWNHNSAYYPWLARRIPNDGSVLDVGCGDGALLAYLDNGTRILAGVDCDAGCVERARKSNPGAAICRGDFLSFPTGANYDAIVFCASLHHMNMADALEKAKGLLAPHGVLLVVGLARPSTALDWLWEGLRVLPVAVLSRLHRMETSEQRALPVSYRTPTLRDVRVTAARILPQASLRQGLYYRYLLTWHKENE